MAGKNILNNYIRSLIGIEAKNKDYIDLGENKVIAHLYAWGSSLKISCLLKNTPINYAHSLEHNKHVNLRTFLRTIVTSGK